MSCKKEDQVPVATEIMTATIGGKAFSASNFVVARAALTTSINGTIGPASNPESIGLSIQDAKLGTFILKQDGEDFAVYNSATGEYISMSGTLQITALSEEWIEGNFNFVAHSITNPAGHITISDGKFKMRFD
jgi:hypothetical protein